MVRSRSGGGIRWQAIVLTTAVLGFTVPAVAQEPAVIWYRSSSGCPSAAAFQARVDAHGVNARIATAGDRLDYVVTLSQGEAQAIGRLERQTDDGVVAIREVTGDTCDEVADAVAFTLELASRRRGGETAEPPRTGATEPPSPDASEPPRPDATEPTAPAAAPAPPPRSSPPLGSQRPEAPAAEAREAGPPRRKPLGQPWLSVAAAGRSAVAPRGAWGGSVAISFEEVRVPWRLEAQLVTGAREAERGRFGLTLGSGRLEVCPVAVERSVRLEWCGGLEVGTLRAEGRDADAVRSSGMWLAGGVQERLRWPADRRFALEGALGLFAPFVAYRAVAEHPREVLHRVDAVGLAASLGVAWRLP